MDYSTPLDMIEEIVVRRLDGSNIESLANEAGTEKGHIATIDVDTEIAEHFRDGASRTGSVFELLCTNCVDAIRCWERGEL